MRIKKYAAAFLAATTVLGSLAACGGDTSTDATPTQPATSTETPSTNNNDGDGDKDKEPEAPVATPIPDRDLGGFEIIIGDHWSPEEPKEPENAQEEATAKYRQEIMTKYNFKIQSKGVASWDDMTNHFVTGVTEGAPAAQVYELDFRFVAEPMKQNLLYDLASLTEFDFKEDKWNQAVKNIMTKGSAVYGMRAAKAEPRGGLLWNKRLFEEAGLDPDLPYNLQASGEWTWSKFEELCKTLTRDTNADGQTDIYATCSHGKNTINCFVTSSGTDYFKVDATGKIVNNVDSKEVIDALNFAKKLYDAGYEYPVQPDPWNYFEAIFQSGQAAMQFHEEYTCQPTNIYGDKEKMPDAVGFVMPPKPDGADHYYSYVSDNIAVIPSSYTAEEASKIAFGYNVYTMATPGYDDPNDWKEAYYSHFEDERAVDETIAMFNDGVSTLFLAQTLIPGMTESDEMGPKLLWAYPFAGTTPAEQVASFKDSWDILIAKANGEEVAE